MCSRSRNLWLIFITIGASLGHAASGSRVLRVCADPNNLPFSNQAGTGIENKLAQILARGLGARLEYVWFAERKNFIDHSLNSRVCDAILGVPTDVDDALVTRPYYRSTYVTVTRADRSLTLDSLYDPRLKDLRIGLHIVEDDYAPPGHLLASQGLGSQIRGYSLYGGYDEPTPPARLIEAVAKGDVDVAIAWGPLAGYFAKVSRVRLKVQPVSPNRFQMIPFTYSIGVAVNKTNSTLRAEMQRVLDQQCPAIQALVKKYGFPSPQEDAVVCAAPPSAAVSSR